MGPFWERDPAMDAHNVALSRPKARRQDSESDIDLSSASFPLCYGPQVEELDVVFDERLNSSVADEGGSFITAAESETSLVGHWGGTYTYKNNAGNDGLVSFTITAQSADGTISGHGKDAWGPFSVRGAVTDGDHLAFIKDYAMLQRGEKVVWYYEATLQADLLAIAGSWGLPQSVMQSRRYAHASRKPSRGGTLPPPGSKTDRLVVLGSFALKRRPVEYFLACPPAEEFARNRPRALWELAINVAIQAADARSRRLDWGALRARSVLRERYVELNTKRKANMYRLGPQETAEFEELLTKIHPDDLHAWNALGLFREGRRIVHR